jgi:A/G-specific adenine glycosylase
MEKKIASDKIIAFKKALRVFAGEHPQRDFPWRSTTDPYAIMVSEIMLQQTQADRVVEKYRAFLKAFPTVKMLAKASPASVLKLWSGLGYNRRALYLKRAAEAIAARGGAFPDTIRELQSLPGIGPYTARAIFAFAYDRASVVIETNIRSVYLHHFFADTKGKVSDEAIAWIVEQTLDRKNPRAFYNMLMDYGAHLKKNGVASHRKSKTYARQSAFRGSRREVRGAILKLLSEKPRGARSFAAFKKRYAYDIGAILETLEAEGFITKQAGAYSLREH